MLRCEYNTFVGKWHIIRNYEVIASFPPQYEEEAKATVIFLEDHIMTRKLAENMGLDVC